MDEGRILEVYLPYVIQSPRLNAVLMDAEGKVWIKPIEQVQVYDGTPTTLTLLGQQTRVGL